MYGQDTDNASKDRKHVLFCMEKGPGPAVYELKTLTGANDHCRTKPQAPSYSIGHNVRMRKPDTPGPQAYRYHSSLTIRGKQEAPAISLKGRAKPPREIDTDIPGPGAYDYKPLYREGTRPTFGPPFKTSTNDLPPPNAYDIKDGIGTTPSHRSSVPAWGVRSRTFFGSCYYDATKAGIPGPAAYGPVDNRVVLPSKGAFTIKSRVPFHNPIDSVKDDRPGPAAYDPSQRLKSGRGFSMGVRHSPYLMPVMCNLDVID